MLQAKKQLEKANHKLTGAEKRQISAIIRKAKGDGKPHTAQQTIPYLAMYPDGICRGTDKIFSKSMEFSFVNLFGNPEEYRRIIDIPPQGDDFDDVHAEYAGILHDNSEKGANGIIKRKYVSYSIENDNPKIAKARLERIETDLLNHFKVIGSKAATLSGRDRLKSLFDIFHPDGKDSFAFDWSWL